MVLGLGVELADVASIEDAGTLRALELLVKGRSLEIDDVRLYGAYSGGGSVEGHAHLLAILRGLNVPRSEFCFVIGSFSEFHRVHSGESEQGNS